MNWIEGPFNEKTILWLGFQVFWWRRFFAVLQFVSGGSILFSLLTDQHKIRLEAWLDDAQRKARRIIVPNPIRIRDVLKWAVLIVLLIAAALTGLGIAIRGGGTIAQDVGAFILIAVVLSSFAVPVALLISGISTMYTLIRAGQHYIPSLLAWGFNHQRIDHSLAIIAFVIFLIASAGQLYLT